ncbi:hypothetical protein Bbelb_058700 [Branchiostoma belcheri]|nr:hypothetical protein Bbelb_058700 [Branchiostoma belcheri]
MLTIIDNDDIYTTGVFLWLSRQGHEGNDLDSDLISHYSGIDLSCTRRRAPTVRKTAQDFIPTAYIVDRVKGDKGQQAGYHLIVPGKTPIQEVNSNPACGAQGRRETIPMSVTVELPPHRCPDLRRDRVEPL